MEKKAPVEDSRMSDMLEPVKKEVRIKKEVAVLDFDRFAEVWDVDTDTESMDLEDRAGYEKQKGLLVKQIMATNMTVDAEGMPTYKLRYPKGSLTEVRFRIPSGQAYMTMDNYKERQGMHKFMSFMGSMTGQNAKTFSNLDARDVKVCMGVVTLFLG